MYKTHCQCILDTAINANFDEVGNCVHLTQLLSVKIVFVAALFADVIGSRNPVLAQPTRCKTKASRDLAFSTFPALFPHFSRTFPALFPGSSVGYFTTITIFPAISVVPVVPSFLGLALSFKNALLINLREIVTKSKIKIV